MTRIKVESPINKDKDIVIMILLFMLCFNIQAESREAINSTRLIIGFHSEYYETLGSAIEATEYINEYTETNDPISLIRPLVNNAVLVHVHQSNTSQLQEVINKLLLLENVRYIEIDKTMKPLQDKTRALNP